MGLKFQKRIKILPGVTVNLSKSGVTTSVGVTGARVTMGRGKTRTTVGLPGSGLSHTTIQSNTTTDQPETTTKGGMTVLKAIGYFFVFMILLAMLIVLVL